MSFELNCRWNHHFGVSLTLILRRRRPHTPSLVMLIIREINSIAKPTCSLSSRKYVRNHNTFPCNRLSRTPSSSTASAIGHPEQENSSPCNNPCPSGFHRNRAGLSQFGAIFQTSRSTASFTHSIMHSSSRRRSSRIFGAAFCRRSEDIVPSDPRSCVSGATGKSVRNHTEYGKIEEEMELRPPENRICL